jgi:heat shock protein HtpX
MRVLLFVGTNVAVIALLTVVLQLFGVEQYFYRQGIPFDLTGLLVFASILGFGGAFVSLMISKWQAVHLMGARVIKQPANQAEQWLLHTVKRQADRLGLPMPEVAIFESPQVNAFATGPSRKNALVAVSSGLLNTMNGDEAEAVLGHEMSHVANGDMVTMTLLQGVLNTFVIAFARIIGLVIDRMVFRNERGYGPGFLIATIVAQLVLGILASIIALWFSRYREFRADAGGAELAGRHKMIAALRRLQAVQQPERLPEQFEAFGISGRVGRGLQQLFMSHPPLAARIAALQKTPQ